MTCRHLLGAVNGYCCECGGLVRFSQLKYSHSVRRLLREEGGFPVLLGGVALVEAKGLDSLVLKSGKGLGELVEVVVDGFL